MDRGNISTAIIRMDGWTGVTLHALTIIRIDGGKRVTLHALILS